MPLRVRLILAVVLAMALLLPLGFAAGCFLAARQVATELAASLQVARAQVAEQLAELSAAQDAGRRAAPDLVQPFNGDRHLVALLKAADGAVLAKSLPHVPAAPAPAWFARLSYASLKPARFALPLALSNGAQGAVLEVRADGANEASEAWAAMRVTAGTLAAFALLTVLLVPLTAARSLRPLGMLAAGFGRLGEGALGEQVEISGPPELARLAAEFNRMSSQLAQSVALNRLLQESSARLLEEERTELARDLHDEAGPLLFAMMIDLASLQTHAEAAGNLALTSQLRSLQESARLLQACVHDLLKRLRPVPALAFGLAPAVTDLVAFWQGRFPETMFTVALPPGEVVLSEDEQEVAYRVVQEGLSNAVRHARPRRIDVAVAVDGGMVTVAVENDAAGGCAPEAAGSRQGLLSMRERVVALGGSLEVGPDGTHGWRVRARFPRQGQVAQVAA